MHILAIEVGVPTVAAANVEVATAKLAGDVARVGYDLDRPAPEAVEICVERLWSAITAAARSAARKADLIEGIALCCGTTGLVLLDGADRPLGPVWLEADRRARPAARQVWAAAGEEFLSTTGGRPVPGSVSAVTWRQRLNDDPYLNRRVRRYLHVNGWLGLRLTGTAAFDPFNASASGLFSTFHNPRWSSQWCEFFRVEPEWLPPVLSGGETLGPLRAAVATELGVPAGIPVKLGTAAVTSTLLGAGARVGNMLHVAGTVDLLAALVPLPRPAPRRFTHRLGVGDGFVYLTHNPIGSAALDWLRTLCFPDQAADEFAGQSVPAALRRATRVTLDPPFLGGDPLEIEAHRAAFRDLTVGTDRLDLLAAVLGAMRRQHDEALKNLDLERPPSRVYLAGGDAGTLRQLYPAYAEAEIQLVPDAALRGMGGMFSTGQAAPIATGQSVV